MPAKVQTIKTEGYYTLYSPAASKLFWPEEYPTKYLEYYRAEQVRDSLTGLVNEKLQIVYIKTVTTMEFV